MNAPQAPLVVIAAVSEGSMKEKVAERLRDVGKKWRVRTEGSGVANGKEVVWTMMDKSRWGQWLKSMYGIQKDAGEARLEDVKIIIADHSVSFLCLSFCGGEADVDVIQRLTYYDTDRTGGPINIMSSSSLFSAVEDASSGKLRRKHSENYVERLARVCFLLVTLINLLLTYCTDSEQEAENTGRRSHLPSYKICTFCIGIHSSIPLFRPSTN